MTIDEEPVWTNWWQCADCRQILDRDGEPTHPGPYTCQHCGKEWS